MSTTVPGSSNFKEFAFVCYGRDIPLVIENAITAGDHLRKEGYASQADNLYRAYETFRSQMDKLGPKAALAGTITLREMELQTRVRPNIRSGAHRGLSDALVAEPLVIPGGVGIANYELLDREVRWWPTNEFGSNARVGGRLFGTFYGGEPDAPPDENMFRQHALFSPGGSEPGFGTIQRPIPARHFIARSIPLINREWRAQYDSIVNDFNLRLQRIVESLPRSSLRNAP